ncbi:MAG: hypothetical protein LBV23_01870 [Deltaproteobacteria bacterium]|jgi:hypothetical protein|nr:hypothetical protein [Deltaproteobacteria bacterium]
MKMMENSASEKKTALGYLVILLAVRTVRAVARIIGFLLALTLLFFKGWQWAVGSLMGAFLIEANLTALKIAVQNSQKMPKNVKNLPLWPLVLKIMALFISSAVYCIVVIRYRIGEPFGFFFGTLALPVALGLGLSWVGIFLSKLTRKAQAEIEKEREDGKNQDSATKKD